MRVKHKAECFARRPVAVNTSRYPRLPATYSRS